MATRVEKAMSLVRPDVFSAPTYFAHQPMPSPPIPPVPTLTDEDMDRFNLWVAKRADGVLIGNELLNMSPALTAAIAAHETFLATPAMKAYAALDNINREYQWRLMQVDVIEALNTKGTVPPTQDTLGVGTIAPAVVEVGELGAPDAKLAPDYVSTGGLSPQLVFGDDGDIVTTR